MSASSEPGTAENRSLNEVDLRERELLLKEKELRIREQEAQAKIQLDKRGFWLSSPLLIGIASAVFGLIGTGVGAALQGYSSFQLERQKFEFSLIQKALEAKDRDEAAKQLVFLVDSGVIKSLDGAKLRQLAQKPENLPTLFFSAPPPPQLTEFDLAVNRTCGLPGKVVSRQEFQSLLQKFPTVLSNVRKATDIALRSCVRTLS